MLSMYLACFKQFFSISLLVSKGKVKLFRYDFWGDYSVLLQYLWRIHSRIPTFPSFPTAPLPPHTKIYICSHPFMYNGAGELALHIWLQILQTRQVAGTLAKELEKHRDYIY